MKLPIVCIFEQAIQREMNECFGDWFILNGKAVRADNFNNSLIYEGESVYEILRVKDGVPVFFNDHIGRLGRSAKNLGKTLLRNPKLLREDAVRLAELIDRSEVNLKMVFNYGRNMKSCLVYYIDPVYPTTEQYSAGVKGILFYAERKDPVSKVINQSLRSEIYHKLILESSYEALLVNRKNRITEGSRSNIFFIRGNELTTSPDKFVLGGITRKHLLEICRDKGIKVKLACVKADSISDYESVIMTGTSPMVLPFSTVGDICFKVNHPLIKVLRNEYLERAEKSRKDFIRKTPAPD